MRFDALSPLPKVPALPAAFAGKVSFSGDCVCSDRELLLLGAAFQLIDMEMAEHPSPIPNLRLNIIFVAGEHTSIAFDEPAALGHYFSGVFFPVSAWRQNGYKDDVLLMAMVEELCHAIWLLPDGYELQRKVESVIRRIRPKFSYVETLGRAFLQRMASTITSRQNQLEQQPEDCG